MALGVTRAQASPFFMADSGVADHVVRYTDRYRPTNAGNRRPLPPWLPAGRAQRNYMPVELRVLVAEHDKQQACRA